LLHVHSHYYHDTRADLQVLPTELLEHLDSPVPVVAGVQSPFIAPPGSHVAVLDLDATVSSSFSNGNLECNIK
jgi:hypothetical protein